MTIHPFTYTKPVTSESTFVGRKEEFDAILEGFESPNCESIGIVGGRRMGKTSLLLEVKRHLQESFRQARRHPARIRRFAEERPRHAQGFVSEHRRRARG